MPGGHERFNKIRPAATLLLSVNCLYQMNLEKRKGEFEKCVSLPVWCRIGTENLLDVTSVTELWVAHRGTWIEPVRTMTNTERCRHLHL